MGVGDGQAQRVCGVRAGQGGQVEQALHHFLHLSLVGATIADHGLLHLQGGVFRNGGHRHGTRHQCCDAGPTRLAQQQRGLRVDVDKNNLHRGAVGLIARHDFFHAIKQNLQACGQLAFVDVGGADGAAGDISQFGAINVNHAKAGGAQAGVNAEDSHST